MSLDQILTRYATEIRTSIAAEVLAKLDLDLPNVGFTRSRPAAKQSPLKPNAKRTPEQIDQLTYALHKYVMRHPGLRIELIGRGMGVSTKELRLPVLRLVEKGQLVSKGQKRSTRYWAK